jgi:hypothetical protein
MSNGSYNLMLDPSMFLTIAYDDRRLEVMMNRMEGLAKDGVALHVPQAFMSFVEERYAANDNATPAGWIDTYNTHAPISYESLYEKMIDTAELIRTFSPNRRLQEEYTQFNQRLPEAMKESGIATPSDGVQESILQEWIFLQERSWMVAAVSKPFEVMQKTGSVARLVLRKKVLDAVVRNTRSKEEEEAITIVDRLITVGECVAAGGGAVAAGGIGPLPPALAITAAISPRFFAQICR